MTLKQNCSKDKRSSKNKSQRKCSNRNWNLPEQKQSQKRLSKPNQRPCLLKQNPQTKKHQRPRRKAKARAEADHDPKTNAEDENPGRVPDPLQDAGNVHQEDGPIAIITMASRYHHLAVINKRQHKRPPKSYAKHTDNTTWALDRCPASKRAQ